MPKCNIILNLPGFTVQNISGYDPVIFNVSYNRKAKCPHCGGKDLRTKDTFMRQVHHEMLGAKRTMLRFKAHKFYCRPCKRYFNQRFPGLLKYQRATERLKQQLCRQHSHGIFQKTLSGIFKFGKATIERWYHRYYWLANQTLTYHECPRVLGIDEHRFGKKFATTFCDLRRNRIFDITLGRSKEALKDYLEALKGREKVQVICIDLSSTYKSIIKQYFPNAKIVADRFHVIRLINQQFLNIYQQLDPNLKYHRGLLAALRTNPNNLSTKRQNKRDTYLTQHPAIKLVYEFKQRLHRLLMYKHRNAKQCRRRLIPLFLKMITMLKQSPFGPMKTLGKTLYQWRDEIARMWRFTKNNGITEGFHRKMKLIQRRAYGFRCFENYRLRVRVLCAGITAP